MTVALGILDLVPLSEGARPSEAVAASLALARAAERAGYSRYWFAEHHLNPGVLGTSPAVMMALAAGVTSTMRVGSGAVLAGHRTPLSVAEEFALLEAAFPGRVDLGLGRSFQRAGTRSAGGPPRANPAPQPERTTPEGLLLPSPVPMAGLVGSERFRLGQQLLTLPGATGLDYADLVAQVQDLLAGRFASGGISLPEAVPVNRTRPQLWVLGSSAGESAELAGERGLRFGANYHVSPSSVIEAVTHYRRAFRPSADLPEPFTSVSADVVVAPSQEEAEHLAAGYDRWVHSIRSGAGAIAYPRPEEALATPLEPEALPLVEDRLRTRFVGTPERVAEGLDVLARATGADELLVTTITHDPALRIRSHELLAHEWGLRGQVAA